ncbi:hypothetical protein AAY473_039941 [Plecturocebus cupreus]
MCVRLSEFTQECVPDGTLGLRDVALLGKWVPGQRRQDRKKELDGEQQCTLAPRPDKRWRQTKSLCHAQAAWTGAMSSPDEVPFWGAHYDMEGGEQAGALTVSPRAPRGHSPEGEGQGEGEGGFADPEDINLELHSELIEQGRVVLWGAKPCLSPRSTTKGTVWTTRPYLAEEQAAIVPPTSVQGHRSPEGAADNWTGLQVGPSKSGALGPGPGARHVASAGPLQVTGPGAGPAWQHRQSGSRSDGESAWIPGSPPRKAPPCCLGEDSDSADQSCDLRPMRVGIGLNEGSQAKPQSPEKTAGTRRHCQQSFSPAPGPFLTSAPFRLPPLVERPAVGELENSPWEKMQSRAQGEVEVRPSCSGAVAAGALPQDPWRRKMAQEKSLGGASLLTLGRAFPSCGERLSATPQEPTIFPPLSDVQPQGMSKKPQKPKHSSPTRKTTRRRTRESQAAARQNNSDRDDDPGAQLLPEPTGRGPGQSQCPQCFPRLGSASWLGRTEGQSANEIRLQSLHLTTTAPDVYSPPAPTASDSEISVLASRTEARTVLPVHASWRTQQWRPQHQTSTSSRNFRASAYSLGGLLPRRRARSGDQQPAVHPPTPERQQPPLGAQGCLRVMLCVAPGYRGPHQMVGSLSRLN